MGINYYLGTPGPALCTWDSDPSHMAEYPAGPDQNQQIYEFFLPEPKEVPILDYAPVTRTLTTLFYLDNANFNTTVDQAMQQAFQFTKCTLQFVSINGATIPLTTAKGGIYTAPSKGGTVILPATQSYAGLSSATDVINPPIMISGQQIMTPSVVYFSLTTPQGATATANISLMGLAA